MTIKILRSVHVWCTVTIAHCTTLPYFDEITFLPQCFIKCDLQEKDSTTEDGEGRRRALMPLEMGRSPPRHLMVSWRDSLTPLSPRAIPSPTT